MEANRSLSGFTPRTRFALRCKSPVKRQKLFDELDNALVVELDLASGKFLAPYYDNSMTWHINRSLRGFKIPLTLDICDVQKKYRALVLQAPPARRV